MVDRQELPLIAAVLATVAVALEDVAASERQLLVGDPHELPQADHRREQHLSADGMHGVVLEALGLPLSSITVARRQLVMFSGS